jgi:hypothetical protein
LYTTKKKKAYLSVITPTTKVLIIISNKGGRCIPKKTKRRRRRSSLEPIRKDQAQTQRQERKMNWGGKWPMGTIKKERTRPKGKQDKYIE